MKTSLTLMLGVLACTHAPNPAAPAEADSGVVAFVGVTIRAAFLPQFSGAFGRMRFLVDDRFADEGARKAAIRWVCQHDLTQARPRLRRWLYMLLYGRRFGWYGTDIFHFDGAGQITGKYTYANYSRPRIRRELGGP